MKKKESVVFYIRPSGGKDHVTGIFEVLRAYREKRGRNYRLLRYKKVGEFRMGKRDLIEALNLDVVKSREKDLPLDVLPPSFILRTDVQEPPKK